MLRSLIIGAALATFVTAGVTAMPMEPVNPPATVDPSFASVPLGAPIKDTTGGLIGTVLRVGKTDDGQIAVVASIDGQPVKLPTTILSSYGDSLVSTMTKAQIQAAAKAAG
jgi:hypothetical protein